MTLIVTEFDVVIKVKPEQEWIVLFETTARAFLRARDFPPRLVDDTAASLCEAMEQFLAVYDSKRRSTSIEMGLACRDGTAQIHLMYDASIPLNPHMQPNYEVPSLDDDSEVSLEGLWLKLIKRKMDRVIFRVNGNRASMIMLKYLRDDALAREMWFMALTPALRSTVHIEQMQPGAADDQSSGGAILIDTRGESVIRLSKTDEFLVRGMDGKRTLRDIYLAGADDGMFIAPQQVKRLYEHLEASGMLEGVKASGERSRRKLNLSFSIPRPDQTVTWIHRHTRFLFNPIAVIVFLLIGLSGLIPLADNRTAIVELFVTLEEHLSLRILISFYFIMLFHIMIHEFAHGVTCKHFGGRVRKLGIMWYLAMFIFFCDTSSSWTFPKKSQRIWVSLAGPLVSIAFFGVVAWILGLSVAASSSWAALWLLLTLFNAAGLAMNFNPLIKMDAYYVMMDWLEIPNLQQRAFGYLKSLVLGLCGGLWGGIRKKSRQESAAQSSGREKRIFIGYGVASLVMSLLFIVLPFWRMSWLWMANRHFSLFGVMTFIAIALIIGTMLVKFQRAMYAARRQEHKIS